MGCRFLLQGIFLTQGSKPGLLNWRQILYHLSHQGSPQHLLVDLNSVLTFNFLTELPSDRHWQPRWPQAGTGCARRVLLFCGGDWAAATGSPGARVSGQRWRLARRARLGARPPRGVGREPGRTSTPNQRAAPRRVFLWNAFPHHRGRGWRLRGRILLNCKAIG